MDRWREMLVLDNAGVKQLLVLKTGTCSGHELSVDGLDRFPSDGRGRDFSTASARDSREQTFRCADLGRVGCNWWLTGENAEQLAPEIEHGRAEHNTEMDENTRTRILDAIDRRSAA